MTMNFITRRTSSGRTRKTLRLRWKGKGLLIRKGTTMPMSMPVRQGMQRTTRTINIKIRPKEKNNNNSTGRIYTCISIRD